MWGGGGMMAKIKTFHVTFIQVRITGGQQEGCGVGGVGGNHGQE